jgi:hypothetical protein
MSDVIRRTRAVLLLLAVASGPVLLLVLSDESRPSSNAVHLGFANTVFAGFMVTSVMLVLTLLAYGDSRDRPAAPVVGILVLVAVGFLLGLRVLEAGGHLSGNGSAQAQFFSDLVDIAPAVFGLGLSVLVGLLSAASGLRRLSLPEAEGSDPPESIS